MKPSPPYVEESDLERLEKIARAATPGPWSADRADALEAGWEVFGHDGSDYENFVADCRTGRDDATYIATFDPPTILSLIRKGQGIEGGSSQSQPCGASKHAAPEAEEPAAWRPIESAPLRGTFLAINAKGDVRKCWRHKPSSRTDEILFWHVQGRFRATHWMPNPAPPPKTQGPARSIDE